MEVLLAKTFTTTYFRFMRNIQGAGSPQKKVGRINPARIQHARCLQTFSHEEIQPFKLSSMNVFSMNVFI